MTSVERVLEYTELDSEAPSETDVKPPDGWPNRGSIRFNNMTFAYAAGLPNVLRGVTAHVKSNEKVDFFIMTTGDIHDFFRHSHSSWCLFPFSVLNISAEREGAQLYL